MGGFTHYSLHSWYPSRYREKRYPDGYRNGVAGGPCFSVLHRKFIRSENRANLVQIGIRLLYSTLRVHGDCSRGTCQGILTNPVNLGYVHTTYL